MHEEEAPTGTVKKFTSTAQCRQSCLPEFRTFPIHTTCLIYVLPSLCSPHLRAPSEGLSSSLWQVYIFWVNLERRASSYLACLESTKRPPTISALLIDVSGTLLVGSEPTTSAVDAFNRLISSDVPVRLCSNTSKESTADLVQNMTSLGFTLLDVPLTKVDPSIRGASPEGRSGGTKLVWTSIGAVAQTLKDLGRNTCVHQALLGTFQPLFLSYQTIFASLRFRKGRSFKCLTSIQTGLKHDVNE